MRYRARAALGLVVLALVGSCVSNDSPTSVGERLPAGIVLQPALIPSPADSSALPINRIRAVTARVPDNTVLSDTTIVVQPTDASWSLDLRIPLPASPTRALSFLYLMNEASGGARSVEFSGRTDTLTLVAGQTNRPADIPLVRGPIGNLFVTGVTITNTTTAIVQGLTLGLTASVQSSAPSTQARVYWTSRDTSVVRIDSTTAFGVAPGVAQVIASAGAFADTTLLTVGIPPVDSVEVSPNSANLLPGQTRAYTVRVLDAGANVLTGRIVRWSTGSASFATVDSITGVVTAVAPGTTNVRATSEGVFDDATVVVVPVPVRSVLVSPDSTDVAVGNTIGYSAQTFDSIGGVLTGRVVTWSSVNTGVATVNTTSGAVTGVAAGTTTVRATSEGVFDDAVVRVTSSAPPTLNRWQSAVSGNWSEAARWSRGTVPVAGDSVAIDVPGTYTVTVDVNSTIAGLLVGGSSGTQTIDISSRTVTLGGSGMIASGGVLNLASSTLNGPGTLTNRGTLVAQSSTMAVTLANESLARLRAASVISGVLTTTSGSTLRVEGDGLCCSATTTVSNGFTNNGLIELTTVNAATSSQLVVTSGTLTNAVGATIEAAVGLGGSRFLNGTLDNQGTLTVSQTLTLTGVGGASTNSGSLTVNADLALNQSGGSFTNTGTATIGSGQTWTVTGGTLNQQGTLGGAGTLSLISTTANLTTPFTNATTGLVLGTTTVNGPGTLTNATGQTLVAQSSTIAAPLVNEGLLRMRAASTISGVLTTTSGSTLRVEGDGLCCSATTTVSNSFTNNGLIELTTVNAATSSQLVVTSGTLTNAVGATIEAAVGLGGSRFLNGTLDNQGTLTVNQPLTLTGVGGAITNSGTLTVNAALALNQSGGSFTNTGAVTVGTGRTWTVTGGTLNQQGVLGGAGTLSLISTTANLTTPFTNATTGLVLGTTTVNGPGTLTNATGQTLVAQSSTIAAPLVNEGLLRMRAASTISGTLTTTSGSTLRVEGDGLCCVATTTVSNGFTNNGLIELTTVNAATSSQLVVTSGTLTNAVGATIEAAVGLGGSRFLNGTLDNQGTLTVSQVLTLTGVGGASTNSGSLTVNADLALNQSGGSFTNTGTATIGSGLTWTVTGGTLNQQGTLGGAGTLSLNSTTANLTTPFTNATTGLVLGTTTVNGPGTLTNATGQTLVAQSSTIAAPLVNEGLLRMRAASTISGVLTTTSGSTLRVEGDGLCCSATTTVSNGFTNNGLIELTTVSAATSSQLVVTSGTLTNAVGATIDAAVGLGGSRFLNGTLDNQGTLTVSQTLTLTGVGGASTNSGSLTVNADLALNQSGGSFTNTGTATIGSGQTWTVTGGTLNQQGTLGGAGTLSLISTTANLTTPFTNATTGLVLGTTTVNGPGTLTNATGQTLVAQSSTIAAPLVNEGLLRMRAASTISGVLTTTSGSTLRVEGDGLCCSATTTVSNSFTNNGLIELTTVNAATSSQLVVTSGTLTNAVGATIEAAVGLGGSRFLNGTLDNQGTLTVNQPLTFTGSLTHGVVAVLNGSSTLDLNAATIVDFAGDVNPGTSPGILSITGPYTPGALSALNIELNGTTVGTDYDRLAVSGAATLGGALVVLDTTAFVPGAGQRYAILTAGTLTGNFSSVTLPTVAGLLFDTAWATAGSVDTLYVETGAAPSQLNRWLGAVSDGWNNPTRWSRGVVPVPTDSVVIDVAGTYTVTLDVDATVAGLVLGGATGAQTLSVPSGRTLTLAGPFPGTVSANGRLDVSGTVNGSATLANAGQVTLIAGTIATPVANAGTLRGSGASTISGALTTTGGSMMRVGQVNGSTSLAQLTVTSGFTNNGTIELTNLTTLGAYSSMLVVTSGTLVNATGATIVTLAGDLGGGPRTLSAALDNQGTVVSSTGHPLQWTGPANALHTNDGLIEAIDAEIALTMTGTANLTNTGTITVGAARFLAITGGTFALPGGGTLNGGGGLALNSVGASFQTAFALGILSATNSIVNIAIGVSTASVSMVLAGSTVEGPGSVTNAAGETLTLVASTINTSIANQGTLVVSGTSAINGVFTTATGSTLMVGQVNGSQSQAQLTVANGFTNNGAIELTNLTALGAYTSRLQVTAGTLTNAPGSTITTLAGVLGGGARTLSAALVNQGTVSTSTGHGLLLEGPSNVAHVNSGLIDASAADVALTMAGISSLTNPGTITVAPSGVFTVNGGTLTLPVGGTLNGGGGLALNSATASLGTNFTLNALSASNSTVTIASGVSTASLTMTFASSTVNGTGSVTNATGRTLTLNNSTVAIPLSNQGTLIASANTTISGALTTAAASTIRIGQVDGASSQATLTVAAGFTNNGAIELTTQFAQAYSAQLTVTSGTLTNAVGATITTLAGLVGGGARTLAATLDNQGTVTVIPGGAGTLTLNGSLTNSGTLNLELGGLLVATQYDRIVVSGAATLGGTLTVATFGGFVPLIGNGFDLLTYASQTGSFTTTNLPGLGLGSWLVGTNPTSVALSVIP